MAGSKPAALPLGYTPTMSGVSQNKKREVNGWGTRIRTWAWRDQNPLPYRLAIPQSIGGYGGTRTCDPIIMSDVL